MAEYRRFRRTAYYLVRSVTEQPYGGPRWPQRSGYTILEEMIAATERAIQRATQPDVHPSSSDWRAPHSGENDPDHYVSHHPDAASYAVDTMGDCCPECGRPLFCTEEAVAEDGHRGDLLDLIPDEDAGEKKAFHPECWPDRHARVAGHEHTTLDQF